MLLDHQRCYDAMSSRDRRFDGRFWVGVRTTGVYCRPVCPSRTPLSRNVDFFAHPAAAEDAGFRPCRRCRPEVAPGSPDWAGNAALVDRGLRLIEAGALDEGNVDDLAARLHVGGRHLRRLFVEQLGTTPDAVARSRRAHLAKRLLTETDLRVADVAFAAGFGSVRQCNDVVRSTFHATPTELRRDHAQRVDHPGALRIRLAVRTPFDGSSLLDFFAARALPSTEEVTATAYRRRVRAGDTVGTVELEPGEDHVALTVDLPPGTSLAGIVASARRLFDLGADPEAVDEHLGSDPVLGPLVGERPGLRVPSWWTGFEAAVRAVVGQQISIAGARTIVGRIVAAHGTGGAFPEPDQLVDAPLSGLGLTGRRIETIHAIARRVVDGDLAIDGTVDHDSLVADLVALPGIGPWTASYIAMRSGEPDAFPAGDLHLRRILGTSDDRDANAIAEPWRPWRAYAATHLWNAPTGDRP